MAVEIENHGILEERLTLFQSYIGIYKHMALGAVGYFTGQKLESMNTEAGRRNLLVIEDYVARHPEDFVEETPKTYGEIMMKWYPVR